MSNLIISGASGIPLSIFNSDTFVAWRQAQPQRIQNWLNSTQFNGKGVSLLPSTEGELEQVIFVSDSDDSYWLCGELVNQLPAGQYQLNANEPQIKTAAFSWGLGAYQFDRYKKNTKELPVLIVPTQAQADEAN
ncbi:leucyl aminopeptidase family protein, partial [Shewanella sp. 0m-11]